MRRIFVLLSFMAASLTICSNAFPATSGSEPAASGTSSDYRVGKRLPPANSQATSQVSYNETKWEALVPADWDPSQAFKGLDMNTLNDADPRAMEALQRL